MLDFLVIGTQKSATSWLYYCLADHPALCLPRHKREVRYVGGARYREEGWEGFVGRFPPRPPGAVRGDVSVDYLVDPGAIAELQRLGLKPRVVCCVRDPVERAVSAYFWKIRTGALPVMPLAEALGRAASTAPPETVYPDSVEGHLGDLVRRGRYGRLLEPWVRFVGSDRILIVEYSEVSANPSAVVERVFDFLGVAADVPVPSLRVRPKRSSYLLPLMRLERTLAGSKVAVRVLDILNRGLSRWRPDPLTEELAATLRPAFEVDQLRFAELLAEMPAGRRPDPQDLLARWGYGRGGA